MQTVRFDCCRVQRSKEHYHILLPDADTIINSHRHPPRCSSARISFWLVSESVYRSNKFIDQKGDFPSGAIVCVCAIVTVQCLPQNKHMIEYNPSCVVVWLIRCLQYLRPVIELSTALIDNVMSWTATFTATDVSAYSVGTHTQFDDKWTLNVDSRRHCFII